MNSNTSIQNKGHYFNILPTNWKLVRLKYLLRRKITDGPHETPTFLAEGVPFLSVDGIQDGELIFDNCRHISKEAHFEFRKKASPEIDDILMGKAASTGKIARVKVDFEFGIWSPLALIKPNTDLINPSYLEYSLKSSQCQAQIDNLCTSNTQKNLSMDDIPSLFIPLPPTGDQDLIVELVSQRTAKIDALIQKKKNLIELLQEKRAALIGQAATKGLDPSVPMKDSGIEWLGEMPRHWCLTKVRYVLPAKKGAIKTGPFGSQLTSDDMQGEDIKVYNQRNVLDKDFFGGDNYISKQKYEELKSFTVYPGDILVTTRGTIGRCCILPDDADVGILHPCLLRIQVNDSIISDQYLSMLIQDSNIIMHQLNLLSDATTIDVIYSDNIRNVIIPLPPISEQTLIIKLISEKLGDISALIQKTLHSLDLLREYRMALVTSAITGNAV